MIGLLLITHDSLGESLLQCACHVLDQRPPQIAPLGIRGADDPLVILPRARGLMQAVDTGRGVLLLTDIFGATPCNIAQKLLQPGRVEGIAGVSLPMLLRALTYRDKDMETLVAKTLAGGRDSVMPLKGTTHAAG